MLQDITDIRTRPVATAPVPAMVIRIVHVDRTLLCARTANGGAKMLNTTSRGKPAPREPVLPRL